MTVSDLLARATSRELTEYQLYFELLHDEALYFHEHPHASHDDYRDACALRDEHERRSGRADRRDDDDDDDETLDDEELDDGGTT